MNSAPNSTYISGSASRWLIAGLAAIVMLIVLFYIEEDVRGKIAWNKFKRAAEANGEKFNLADVIPPPVPDEENFAMTPLLSAALDYEPSSGGVHRRDANAYQHLSNIRINLGRASGNARAPEMGGENTLVDLKAAADFYRGNASYPQSASSADAGEVVLTALNKFAPDLEELREASAHRPYSRFPIDYGHEPSFAILLPHLAELKGIGLVCDLRVVAELETHRTADAFADLQLGFRMADSVHGEPILIDHLVRLALLNAALQGVREGLARQAWTDANLVDFEKYLASIDLLVDYKQTMRGERNLNLAGIDFLRRHSSKSGSFMSASDKSTDHALTLMPSGWYYRNMVLIADCYQIYLLPSVNESNRTVSPKLGDVMLRELGKRPTGPYNIFAKMLIPAYNKASQRSARTQTLVDEARIACALERYRMEHNDFPDALTALVPQFIPKIPNDLFDGQPLRYQKNPDGTYILYSIGWNQRDDGGITVRTSGSTPHMDPNNGDWVWTCPAK
ncbi:MAG TPA: hypothetical protein VG938_16985 [Verrucomicrobiae bacterium]|jgi:hypothetical protein|nr:hypothetical protein [Verrucomicrobiae bacterium]